MDTRLLKYRLSWLVGHRSFRELPVECRSRLIGRFKSGLQSGQPEKLFGHLSEQERRMALKIVKSSAAIARTSKSLSNPTPACHHLGDAFVAEIGGGDHVEPGRGENVSVLAGQFGRIVGAAEALTANRKQLAR